MSDKVTLFIGNPEHFRRSADGQLYQVANVSMPLVLDESGILYPVQAVISRMFPPTDGSMGDYYDGEWVGPGSPNPGYTGLAAPPGGWCFKTINGKLTAYACNQAGSNTPQGSLLSASDTRSIQAQLNKWSSSQARLSVDGAWGPKTSARLKEFQSLNGLAATGIMDAATRTKLFSGPQTAATPTNNNTALQTINNSPPPNSGFNLSSLFGDSTTLWLVIAAAVVVIARR
jgi:hypothetical protein